jgi:hypothetical protein
MKHSVLQGYISYSTNEHKSCINNPIQGFAVVKAAAVLLCL